MFEGLRHSIFLPTQPVEQAPGAGWRVLQGIATLFFIGDAMDTLLTNDISTSDRFWGVVAPLAALLLCWSPILGAVVAVTLLLVLLVVPDLSGDIYSLALLPPILLWRLTERAALALVVFMLLYLPLIATKVPEGWMSPSLIMRVIIVTCALAIGWVLRMVMLQRRHGVQRIQQLEEQNARIRSDERGALARELHDVVAHQLSIISLQTMGHREATDSEELRGALDRVAEASGSALSELQLLLEVLRDDDPRDASAERLAEVLPPTRVAHDVASTLRDHGHHVDVRVSDDADRLEASQQVTISRVLQEAATNILRHAPSGAACQIAVDVFPRRIVVDVRSPVRDPGASTPLEALSLGYGLRGIRERVDLVGGSLKVGPHGDQWVLHMTLPHPAFPDREAI